MTEYEMLYEICTKIWYKLWEWSEFLKIWDKLKKHWIWEVSSKEIIFSQEFIDKLIEYMSEKEILTSSIEEHNIYYNLMKNNLNNPTQYIYNLIK